jgi:ABC-type Fe3+/spermidine/putrescine transport system ATPase subunit
LKMLQERVGITFVYVTHDQEEALTMSDRIGVMDQGKLLQIGTAREVYEAPMTRFVSDFIGDTNYLYGPISAIQGEVGEIVVGQEVRIWAPLIPGLKVGQEVSVAFRPEKIMVNAGDVEGCNSISGNVREIIYTGSNSTYLVEILGGHMVTVKQQNTDATFDPQLREGDKVEISWPVMASKAFSEIPSVN